MERSVDTGTAFVAGGIECRLLRDGDGGLPPEVMFTSAPPDERAAAIDGLLDDLGRVPAVFNCLLVRAGSTTVLVDAGLGELVHPFGSNAGYLLESLRTVGVACDEIDLVVITHAHPDHVGGLVRNGKLVFPTATHVVSSAELAFWRSDDEVLGRLPPVMAEVARDVLGALEEHDVLDAVEAGTELLSGLRLVAAPGHTPGQLALEIGGEAGGALFLADAVVHPLHVEHPDWTLAPETSFEDVIETRHRLLDRAAAERRIVAASHIETTGVVERTESGYAFRPGI